MKVITTTAITFAVIGISLAWFGIRAESQDKKGDKWVETPAIITQKFIRLKGSSEPYNILNDLDLGDKEDKRLFFPEIRFIYKVKGQKYGGDKIGPVVFPVPKEITKKAISLYTRGQKVKVYYNKEKPEEAVLFKRYQNPKQMTLFGFAAIIISMLILWISGKFSSKSKKKQKGFYSQLLSKDTEA